MHHSEEPNHTESTGSLSARQRQEQEERLAVVDDGRPKPRRRWRYVLGSIAAVVLLVVVLLPQIAAMAAKGRVESAASDALGTNVRIEKLGLSWFGDQRVGGLRLIDDELREAADIDLRLERSLFSFLTGWQNLGTLVVSGSVTANLNEGPFADILNKEREPSDEPTTLPSGLKVRIVFDDFDVRYVGAEGRHLAVDDLSGDIDFGVDQEVTADLQGALAPSGGEPGALSIEASVKGLTEPSGLVTSEKASGTLALDIQGAESLVASFTRDQFALGATEVSLDVEGSAERGVVRFAQGSTDAETDLALTYQKDQNAYTIALERPGAASISAELVELLVPAFGALDDEALTLDERSVRITSLPGVALRLDELSASVPLAGSFDLNAITLRAVIETGPVAGKFSEETWSVEPATFDVTTRGVTRGLAVQGVTTAQLADEPAGALIANLRASSIWNESGRLPEEADALLDRLIAGTTGSVEITGIKTALAASFAAGALESAGIVPSQDLGESIDIEVSLAEGEPKPIRAWLTADHVEVGGSVEYTGGVIRSTGDGLRARAETIAPLLSRKLGERYAVDEGGQSELWIRDFVLDLANLTGEGDTEGVDLRAVSGTLELRTQPVSGRIVEGDTERTFSTSPLAVTADLSDIGRGATLAAQVALTVEERAAGDINISLRANDLVNERGRLIAGVPTIDGEIAARGVRTELLQPLVVGSGLTLSRDVGETLDLTMRADVDAQDVAHITGNLAAEELTGSANLEIRDRVLRAVDEGVRLEMTRVGAALGRMLSDRLNTGDSGSLTITSQDLVIARGQSGIVWSEARASATRAVRGVTFRDAQDTPFEVERLDGEFALGENEALSITLNGVVERAGEPALLAGQLTLLDLLNEDQLSLVSARLGGRLDVTGFPIAAATEAVDMGARDARALTAELVGRLLDLSLVADADSGEIQLTITGDRLNGEALGSLREGTLSVSSAKLESVIDESVIEQIRLRSAQSRGQTDPIGGRFVEPARLALDIGAFDVLRDGSLDLAGTPMVRFEASGQIEGWTLEREEGPVELGAMGLKPLVLEGRIPMEGVLGDAPSSASLAVSGQAVSGESTLGVLVGGMDVSYASGALDGPLRLDLQIEEVDTGLIDEVLVLEGLIAGTLGATAEVQIIAEGTMQDASVGELDASVSMVSPRLWTESPISLEVSEAMMRVAEPGVIIWQLEPEVATRIILRQPIGAERIRATEPFEAHLHVNEAVLSRGTGIFEPGIFKIDSRIDITPVTVFVPDEVEGESRGVTHVYKDIELTVKGETSQVEILGNATPTRHPEESLSLEMELRNFAAEGGKADFESATASAEVVAQKAPSALIDALLRQGGLMSEVLGPDVTIEINASNLRAESGDLTIDIQAPRASGSFVGTMFEGRLIATEPAVLTVTQVRPELGEYLTRAVPVIGTVTKTADDGPAVVTINTLEIPLVRDDQLSRLQQLWIEAVIDLGEARFATSSVFSSVMKAAGQRSEGGLGRKMEPINLTVNSGNLIYPRTKIPIGEFTIESAGKFRLTDRYIDIVTYIPMAALSEEALGSLKTGFTSALGRQLPVFESATMVPWRTRGLPGDRTTKPDIQKLVENLGDTLNPLNLINQGLGSVQDLVIDRKDKNEPAPTPAEPAPAEPEPQPTDDDSSGG